MDTRQARREATTTRILDAAWQLAAEDGLAGISLHELARRVGMRQPSLYTYFPSKHGLYDLMFAQAYAALLQRMRDDDAPTDPRRWLRHSAQFFLDWACESPARFQLLFQRTIPQFEPSSASYAIAIDVEHEFVCALEAAGFDEPTANPVWGLILIGLADQQIANDPGGDQWRRLIDPIADMFWAQFGPKRRSAR